MGETAILELSLGFCAAVMHSALGFNFKMRESEYRIAMAEGMSGHANCVLEFQNVQFNDSMKLFRSNEILRFIGSMSTCTIVAMEDALIVNVGGILRFFWEYPGDERILVDEFSLLQLIDGAKDWLLSMPELSAGGFRAFLDKKAGKKFFSISKWFCRIVGPGG